MAARILIEETESMAAVQLVVLVAAVSEAEAVWAVVVMAVRPALVLVEFLRVNEHNSFLKGLAG